MTPTNPEKFRKYDDKFHLIPHRSHALRATPHTTHITRSPQVFEMHHFLIDVTKMENYRNFTDFKFYL